MIDTVRPRCVVGFIVIRPKGFENELVGSEAVRSSFPHTFETMWRTAVDSRVVDPGSPRIRERYLSSGTRYPESNLDQR